AGSPRLPWFREVGQEDPPASLRGRPPADNGLTAVVIRATRLTPRAPDRARARGPGRWPRPLGSDGPPKSDLTSSRRHIDYVPGSRFRRSSSSETARERRRADPSPAAFLFAPQFRRGIPATEAGAHRRKREHG